MKVTIVLLSSSLVVFGFALLLYDTIAGIREVRSAADADEEAFQVAHAVDRELDSMER